jgi:hypothetical protein
MGWFLSLIMISVLVAFNMFAADTMIRMRNDVKEIHKAVVTAAAPIAAAAAAEAAAAAVAAAAAPPSLPIGKKK